MAPFGPAPILRLVRAKEYCVEEKRKGHLLLELPTGLARESVIYTECTLAYTTILSSNLRRCQGSGRPLVLFSSWFLIFFVSGSPQL
jgi:hypothetical protein